jgi:signal transduction histidine kinase
MRLPPLLTRPPQRQSLATELLATVAVLAAAALLLAVGGVVLLVGWLDPAQTALYLSLLIAADVGIFVVFGALQLQRLVLRPLRATVDAAEAIAAGDLARRVPSAESRELEALATSVNRMTERLLEERTQLVRAEKLASVGRLAAGVAHEIGNPLGAIHGYAHLARSQVADRPAALDALAGLERESARIDRIVRGLLDYARPRRQTPLALPVNDAVRTVAELLAAQGALRRVALALDLDDSSPRIVADRHDVEQLFVNLLINAVDAMGGVGRLAVRTERIERATLEQARHRVGDEGYASGEADDRALPPVPREPSPRVRIWLARAVDVSAAVKLVVADSGPGIAPADAERVFDPFFTTKDPGQGTGLGLAIVLRTVESAGGTVWVERSREGGAAFHLLVPAAA